MRKPDRRRSDAEVGVDMTPMIDVTFLLLIFFLCLEFKTLEGKLHANLPRTVGDNRGDAVPLEKVDLEVRCLARGDERPDPHGGRFELVGHEFGWRLGPVPFRDPEALLAALRGEARVEVPDPETGRVGPRPVTLHWTPGVTYGDVTRTIDLVRHAGFGTVTFGRTRTGAGR